MKKIVITSLAVLLLLPLLGAAQNAPKATADISFSFHAGDKVLPAGLYDFKADVAKSTIRVLNIKTNESIMVSVLTRISQREGNETLVVFDQVKDQYYLSEIHMPGVDGFHLQGAPGPHNHVTIKAK